MGFDDFMEELVGSMEEVYGADAAQFLCETAAYILLDNIITDTIEEAKTGTFH
tara:strand:+ start:240 stop:398 length:159 start_codon:yes stop_codon:yes gene_type:complete